MNWLRLYASIIAKHRKYVKDYYWASSREWVLNELACELGVELFNEDFELIGD